MKQTFRIDIHTVRRVICAMLATLLVVAGLPLLRPGHASAITPVQLASRSIQMSDSGASGTSITSGVGSGTAVTYQFSFTPTNQAGSFVVDFCDEDPIIGDTCTAPTGMAFVSPALSQVGAIGTVGGTGWSIASTSNSSSGNSRIKIKDDGVSGHDAQSGVAQAFQVTGITNPSAVNASTPQTVGTFYARIYGYTDNNFGGGSYTSPAAPGTYVDYGGIALSTNQIITITARVQEELTFCVSGADPSGWASPFDCSTTGATTAPAVSLGVVTSSGAKILDTNSVYTGEVWSQLSTNATHGAVVDLRNSNTGCGGLSAKAGGGTSAGDCPIQPVNNGSGSGPTNMVAGGVTCDAANGGSGLCGEFGLFVNSYVQSSPTVGSTGTVAPTAGYFNSGHCGVNSAANPCPSGDGTTWYGMDTATTPTNGGTPATNVGSVISTFGSTVANTATPVNGADNSYTFAATASLTTPAGIYAANMNLIATGTF